MKIKAGAVVIASIMAASVSEYAAAECSMPLEVTSAKTGPIQTYQEDGTRAEPIDRAELLNRPVVDCDESMGLVKVQISAEKLVWIKRSETRRLAAASAASGVCVVKAPASPSDHNLSSVSGAEPTQADCNSSAE